MRKLSASPFGIALAVPALALLVEWARAWLLSPDLAWGWAVPVLSGYFLWMRRIDLPGRSALSGQTGAPAWVLGLLLLVAAGSRLWLEPFPGWPLMEWIYSLSMLGLILLLIAQFEGRGRAQHLLFPLALGLVAIPWPTFINERIIGSIRIGLADLVAELLTLAHWPAVATGTTIETARGSVGIEEACGGIHSLQTAVLVALAAGELRRASWPRRFGWLAVGIAISLFFNTSRIAFLAWECAVGGTAAANHWHDPAATAEMLLILAALGGLAIRPGAKVVKPAPKASSAAAPAPRIPSGWTGSMVAIVAAVVVMEGAVALWFGWPNRLGAGRQAAWPAHLPSQLLSYREDPYTDTMDDLLHADHHELGQWRDGAGAARSGYVLEWDRGQRAQYVLRGHNPDICLGLAGSVPQARGRLGATTAGNFPLQFETRVFRQSGRDFYVYFLAWNLTDNLPIPWGAGNGPSAAANAWSSRWEEIAAHRRSLSARVLTIAIYDAASAEQAEAGFRDALQLITRGS